jgi:serine-type D-Ala-D-Ala carboxypeptidase/endopeptidase
MSDIGTQLQAAMKKKGVVGAAVGYIQNGQTQFYFSGKTSVLSDKPISRDTIFEIGSITKVFTTLILMMLSSRGEIHLDDSIDIFLPFDQVPHFNGHKITLRHLATHSSGLPSFPSTLIPKNPKNPYKNYSIEDLYYFLQQYSLKRKPGDHFLYSNLGMGLLAHILRIKTQKSYKALILEHVLEPLSMDDSGVEITAIMKDRMCMGHNIGKTVEFWDTPEAIVGSGGLRSNIQDMTKFLAANLGFVQTPITNFLKKCHKRLYSTETSGEYCGFGWIISGTQKGDVIWHDGITGGFANFIGFNQHTQKGLVILTNSRKNWLTDFSFSLLNS